MMLTSGQTLTTDKLVYEPGDVALIIAGGFAPGEVVTLQVLHADGSPANGPAHQPWTKIANSRGFALTSWHASEECLGQDVLVSATGSGSGGHINQVLGIAQPNCNSGTGVVTLVGTNGSCLDETPPQGNGPYAFEVIQGGTYQMTISGVTECSGTDITVFIQNTSTGNFCFNATGGSGTYVGSFTMPSNACFTSPISYKCGANAPCNNANTFDARGPNGECTAHLRASTFDGNCNRTGDDEDCGACTVKDLPTFNYCPGCMKGDIEAGLCDPWVDLGCNPTTLPEWDPNITASDNCGPVEVTGSAGVLTVQHGCIFLRRIVHRAHNEIGEVKCVEAFMWTIDTTGPSITCPPDITVGCNDSTEPSNTGIASATDGCGGPVLIDHSDVDAPGNCAGNHVITRTWTATDNCLNTSSCVQTITVADTTGPSITCPPNANIGCLDSTDPSNTGTATATDDCSGVASIGHSDSDAPGNCAGNHVITRTWTATDNCGNTSSCEQTITITDTTGPMISCPPAANIDCEASTDPSNTGIATAIDACSGVASIGHSDSDAPGNCAGNHVITRTWTATDNCGNSSSCQQTITVTDTTRPTISCPPDMTVNGGGLCCVPVELGVPTSSDNCSGVTITNDAPALFCLGKTKVIWTSTDGCGNYITCRQTITVLGQICATKFYDANANGVQDNGEVGIEGWPITVTGTANFGGVTDANGQICFDVGAGTYMICECIGDDPWVATTPGCVSVTIDGTNCGASVSFGNYCYEAPSGGHTIGFWRNPNGEEILAANDCGGMTITNTSSIVLGTCWRTIVNNLNLRNADGTDYNVSMVAPFTTAYTDFRAWLQGATATNMAYMLSAQLASAALSDAYIGLDTSMLVVVPGGSKAGSVCVVPFLSVSQPITCGAPPLLALTNTPGDTACSCTSNDGVVMISDLFARANCLLGAYPTMVAASTQRTYADCVKSILDAINNNGAKGLLCGELTQYIHSSACTVDCQ